MATRSFLTDTELESSLKLLEPLKRKLDEPLENQFLDIGSEYSKWLSIHLETMFSKIEGWEESHPIALGSWARDELCPKSDIDLLFCGDVSAALKFVDAVQKKGIRIRYRIPKDMNDWTVGVESFDTLAFMSAKAFTFEGAKALARQKQLLFEGLEKTKKTLLKDMRVERKERNDRYDSITNYLQPNIKYGKGGLRDIQQGLYIFGLYRDKFADAHVTEDILNAAKKYILTLRHLIHIFGSHDVIDTNVQFELKNWGGYKTNVEFMRDLQTVIAEVSFLTDWIVERALASQRQIEDVESLQITRLTDALALLKANPSLLTQEKVRRTLDGQTRIVDSFLKLGKKPSWRVFSRYFHPNSDSQFFQALFRSEVIDLFVPELSRIRGLVQHDQYHRYTVDGHIAKIIQLFSQATKSPKNIMGEFSEYFKALEEDELKIILWTCLFHDLAKGLPGDHSDVGEKLCEKQLSDWGAPQRIIEEVPWMVKNHLLLSQAAFRHNPSSSSNWQFLKKRGVTKKRLIRLACFTVFDIQATNPDAWNSWKQGLLKQLVTNMLSNKAERLNRLFEKSKEVHLNLKADFFRTLSEDLVEEISVAELIEDYRKLQNVKGELPVLITKGSSGTYWLRFHKAKDQPGIFLQFVKMVYSAGAQVQQAHLRTHNDWGVYDWFCVKTNKKPAQLKKLFSAMEVGKVAVPDVPFSKVSILGVEDGLHLLSFTGLNQSGGLLKAAHDLYQSNLSVQWAKTHTWGQQVEFIFAVKATKNFDQIIEKLRLGTH